MTARAAGRAGFTLVELVIAAGLASIVMLGLSYLIVPLVRAEVLATKTQAVDLNLAGALRTAELEISQASWLSEPSQPGVASDRLEGCRNASPPSAGAPPAPIDPSLPMSWFALCPADGRLYYHTGDGCPPSYSCGAAPASSFGAGAAPRTQASFTRASALTTVVEISLAMTAGGASESVQGASSFSGAAGSGQ